MLSSLCFFAANVLTVVRCSFFVASSPYPINTISRKNGSETRRTIQRSRYKKKHVAKQELRSDDFGLRVPAIQKFIFPEKCYLCRSTRRLFCGVGIGVGVGVGAGVAAGVAAGVGAGVGVGVGVVSVGVCWCWCWRGCWCWCFRLRLRLRLCWCWC